jgi:hypothetical protein
MQAVYAMELSDAERFAGDASPSVPDLEDAHATLTDMGERDYRSTVCAYLARALAEAGDGEAAARWADEGEETASVDDIPSQIAIRLARSILAARQGDRDRARRLAEEAVTLAEVGDDPVTIGDTSLSLARILLQTPTGSDEGRLLAERALVSFEAKGALRLAERARDVLAEPPM